MLRVQNQGQVLSYIFKFIQQNSDWTYLQIGIPSADAEMLTQSVAGSEDTYDLWHRLPLWYSSKGFNSFMALYSDY
jgi:hypothetical protein